MSSAVKAGARQRRLARNRGEKVDAAPKVPDTRRVASPRRQTRPNTAKVVPTDTPKDKEIEERLAKGYGRAANDPMYTQALNLSFAELDDLCEVKKDKNFRDLCSDVEFWRAKAAYQYPSSQYITQRYDQDRKMNLAEYKKLFSFIADYHEYKEVGDIELRNVIKEIKDDIALYPGATVTFVDDIRKLAGNNNPEGYQDFNILDFLNHDPQGLSGISGPLPGKDPLDNADQYYGRTPDTINNYTYVDNSLSVTDPVQNAKEEYYYRREEWYEQEYALKYSQGPQPIYREYRLSMYQERFPLPVHLSDDYPLLLNSHNQPFLYHTYPAFNIVVSILFFPSANAINIRVRSGPGFHRTKTNLFPDVAAFKEWTDFIMRQGYYPRKLPLMFNFIQKHKDYVVIDRKSQVNAERLKELAAQWDTMILGLYNRDKYAYELNVTPGAGEVAQLPSYNPLVTASVPFDVLYTIALGLPYERILEFCANDPRFLKVCNAGFWRDKIEVDFMETDGFRQFRSDYINYVDSVGVDEYVTLYKFLYEMHDYFKSGLSRFDQDIDRIERDLDIFGNIGYDPAAPVNVKINFVDDIAELDGQDNKSVDEAISADRRYRSASGSAQLIARERLFEEYYQSVYGNYNEYLNGAPFFKQYVFKMHKEQLPLRLEYIKNSRPEPPQVFMALTDLVVIVSMVLDPETKIARVRVISYPTNEQSNPLGTLSGFTDWLGFGTDNRKIAIHGKFYRKDNAGIYVFENGKYTNVGKSTKDDTRQRYTPDNWKSFGDFSKWLHSVADLGYAYIIHPILFEAVRKFPMFFISADKANNLTEKSRLWDDKIYRLYRNACKPISVVQCSPR